MVPTAEPAIDAVGLTKVYKRFGSRSVCALNEVSLRIDRGSVTVLIGPNGAGKTTLLRILSSILKPTSGSAKVLGYDIVHHPESIRRQIGFLAANTGLYPRLTPLEVLQYFGKLYGLRGDYGKERIAAVVELFQLSPFLSQLCDRLSTGMKQRVNLARTFLHDPELLILDEPTTGLDIVSSIRILEAVRHHRNAGKTVLLCTHNLSEVEKLADRLVVLREGSIAHDGPLTEFQSSQHDFAQWITQFYPETVPVSASARHTR